MRTRTIEIDLSSNSKSFKTLKYKQFDHNNLLEVIVKDNRKLVDLTSHTISVFFLLPDGQVIQRNVSFKDGKIPVLLENIVLRLSGEVLVEINLLKDEQIVTSFTIYLDVEKSIDRNSAVEGDPVWDILKDASTTIENVKVVIDEIKIDTDVINEDIQDAKTDISNIKSDLSPLKTDISVAKTDISNIKSDLNPLKTDVSVAKTDISNIKTNINTAKTDVNEINTNIENVQKDMNTINSNISSVQNNIGVIISDVTKINKDLVDIGNNIDTTENSIDTIEENIDEINSTVNKIRTDADTVISDINKVNTDIDTIEGNINNINEELNEINTNIEFVNNVNEEFEKLDKLETKEIGIIEIAQKNTKVENTANGYFSNVKVEGKTLVNVVNKPKNGIMTIEQELGDGNWVNTTENSLITPSVKGKTLVNLESPDEFVVDSYSITFGGLWKKPLSKQDLRGRKFTMRIDTGTLDTTNLQWALYRSLPNGTVSGVKSYGRDFNWLILDLSDEVDIDMNEYAIFIQNHDGTSFVEFNPNEEVKIMLFEGDLTQTPELIPTEYVEGLKSSFEDNKIPETDLLDGLSVITNKESHKYYTVSVKPNTVYTLVHPECTLSTNLCQTYCVTKEDPGFTIVSYSTSRSKRVIVFNTDSESNIRVYCRSENLDNSISEEPLPSDWNQGLYLFEGDYSHLSPEDFKHSGKYKAEYKTVGKNEEDTLTLYLNSPLLEGDEIKIVDGKLGHYHKMGKVVFDGSEDWRQHTGDNNYCYRLSSDLGLPIINFSNNNRCKCDTLLVTKITSSDTNIGIYLAGNIDNGVGEAQIRIRISLNDTLSSVKQWLQTNPTTIVYELKNPYFEPLTDDIQFIQAYENGHLQIETNVPVIDVKTEPLYIYPHYLNASTEYLVQFYSNREGEVIVTLGTTSQTVQVQSGINKIYLTTSSNVNPILKLSGDNIKIKDIMIVEKTDNEVEYFEGIKSIGEDVDDMSIITYKTPMRFGKGGRL